MHDRKHRDAGTKPAPSDSQPAVPSTVPSRRRFLFALGASGAAAASAGALAAAPATAPAAGTSAADQGYRETAHVRDYYASARH